jgi:hypothetical protein
MHTQALHRLDLSRLRLTRRDALRGLAAGSVWGVLLTIGLTAMTAWSCGVICPPEIAVNAGLSLTGGILGIGAVAAYGGRR